MNNKSLAILGFVLSFFVSIAGLIISAVALKKFKESGETDGKGFATAGLIIGIIGLVGGVIGFACIGCIGGLAAAGGAYGALLF